MSTCSFCFSSYKDRNYKLYNIPRADYATWHLGETVYVHELQNSAINYVTGAAYTHALRNSGEASLQIKKLKRRSTNHDIARLALNMPSWQTASPRWGVGSKISFSWAPPGKFTGSSQHQTRQPDPLRLIIHWSSNISMLYDLIYWQCR
jgi:hypothetical protein